MTVPITTKEMAVEGGIESIMFDALKLRTYVVMTRLSKSCLAGATAYIPARAQIVTCPEGREKDMLREVFMETAQPNEDGLYVVNMMIFDVSNATFTSYSIDDLRKYDDHDGPTPNWNKGIDY